MSRASLAASRADSSSAVASSACSRASSAAASAASRRPAARSAAFSARSSSRSRERRSARASRSSVSSRRRRSRSSRRRSSAACRSACVRPWAPASGGAWRGSRRRRGGHVGAGHQPPGADALGVRDHAPAVERGADARRRWRRPAAWSAGFSRVAALGLRPPGLSSLASATSASTAARSAAAASRSAAAPLPATAACCAARSSSTASSRVVDEVAVLACERVGRPGGLGRLRQLGDHVRGLALLRLAQLAGGGVALARELLERQAVEPAGDLLDRVSHLRPGRRP